jgi:hypothetical protein
MDQTEAGAELEPERVPISKLFSAASEAMSSAFHQSMGAHTKVARVKAASLLRRQYEAVFAASGPPVVDLSDPVAVEGDQEGQPMYWRTVLRDAAEQMVAEQAPTAAEAVTDQEEKKHNAESLSVAYNGHTYEFPRSKRIVLIGVRHGCDIVLREKGASRLHAVLLILPRELYVLDMGALSGVRMYAREDQTRALLVSTEHDRCVMTCGTSEAVVLNLHTAIVTIHPRVCIVCMDHVRNVCMEPCRHFVCCSACAAQCDTCPQCRAHIVKRNANFHGVMSHAAVAAPTAV